MFHKLSFTYPKIPVFTEFETLRFLYVSGKAVMTEYENTYYVQGNPYGSELMRSSL